MQKHLLRLEILSIVFLPPKNENMELFIFNTEISSYAVPVKPTHGPMPLLIGIEIFVQVLVPPLSFLHLNFSSMHHQRFLRTIPADEPLSPKQLSPLLSTTALQQPICHKNLLFHGQVVYLDFSKTALDVAKARAEVSPTNKK